MAHADARPAADEVRRRLSDLRRRLAGAGGRARIFLTALAGQFFKNAPEAFVLGYRPEDLQVILAGAFQALVRTRGARMAVSAWNPDPARDGFASDRTILQISAPDGPFYVTSVRERLRVMRHPVIHLVHPILPVAWNRRGQLTALGDPKLKSRQSLIHVEIERVDDPAELRRIESAVAEVFADIGLVVRDFERMRLKLERTRRELEAAGAEKFAAERRELAKFLFWLDSGNFVFLGYREYDLLTRRGRKYIGLRRGSGLGILRRERQSRFYRPAPLSSAPAALRRWLAGPAPYVIAHSDDHSPIYRRERMVYLGVKSLDARGRVEGEHRWVGLFTNRVEGLPPTEIPILQEKFGAVISADGVVPQSHDYREMYGIFCSYPKDFLFGASVDDLRSEIRAAMAAQHVRDFKATFRPSSVDDEISVVVVMSRDKFNREVRLRFEDCLRARLAAVEIETSLSMGVEGGEFARLYFSCVTPRKTPVRGTFADLEREMADLAKTWPDRLQEELAARKGSREGTRLAQLYAGAFSVEFHSHTTPAGAVHDVEKLEALHGRTESQDPVQIDLFNTRADPGCSRIKLYHLREKLPLSDIMPVLTDHGFRVVDEVSNSVRVAGRPLAFIHTFRVQRDDKPVEVQTLGAPLCESVLGAIRRDAECDPMCSLILLAGLRPRDVALLRLYRNFLHQIVPVHTLRSIESALVRHPETAGGLLDFFRARFDPSLGAAGAAARRRRVSDAEKQMEEFLEGVEDLLEDRILRLMANAIHSTVRTNYYQTPARRALGVKIRSSSLLSAPKPVPLFEIFVSDPDFEGVHLRGGRIARGGIRHSDRRDDFRTEILGLMKTQMVKNAIIVPVGAKGGFVVKSPVPKDRARETHVRCYRSFIQTLLDLTDNEIGRLAPPAGCVIYDEPDPYLVVAADKGTADFSDIANAIAIDRGYWLGDAFASGGKSGYDHKKLGITARGVWECIRHHLGTIGAPSRVTCAGIGDMSGDVFGNGMRDWGYGIEIMLLAAFNHQYIFLDPAPDARRAAAERERLFRLPRSTWADYDPAAISRGGGVYLRSAKKISLSAEAARMLELPSRGASGEEVIRAILKMKVDLLYNGGIGAYVKSSAERHADVGDPANDRVRIDAADLRCRIIGEGGNGGLTQAARIEFARTGRRLNTDAVDNSAGVDLSDHEVNLKIGLRTLGVSGARRDRLLRRLSGPVSRAVLEDNALQSRILTLEEWRSRQEIQYYPRLIELLSADGLSRDLEWIPSDKELAERARQSLGLVRPELAVLLAYVKITINRAILEQAGTGKQALSADPVFGPFFHAYFPGLIVGLQRMRLANHITATTAANAFVNRAGLTFAFRLSDETGKPPVEVVRAYLAAESLVRAADVRARVNRDAAAVQAWHSLELGLADLTRWLLREYGTSDVSEALKRFRSLPDTLPVLDRILSEADKKRFFDAAESVRSKGVSADLALRLARIQSAVQILDLMVAEGRYRRLLAR